VNRRDLLALAASLPLGGCGASASRALTWWAMSTQGAVAPQLVSAFTAATGIAVDVQPLPWTAAHEKVLTAFAGGALPDILMVANDWLAELAMLGVARPVPGAFAGALPAAGAAVAVDGVPRALPWTLDTQVAFFHRGRLGAAGYAAPPATWHEWRAMGHALKRRRPDDYPLLLLLDWPEVLMTWGAQGTEPLLRDRDTRGNFATPGFRAALAFYVSLFADRLAAPLVGAQAGDTLAGLAQGRFAVLPSTASTVGDLNQLAGFPHAAWSLAAMPTPGPRPAPVLLAGASLVVTRDCRDPARAWQLVRFLCAPAAQRRLHALTGDLPAASAAWAEAPLAGDPLAAVFADAFTRGVGAPAVPEWARIVFEVQAIAERTVRGEFGIDAATAAMDTRVDAILAKRRWLLDRGRPA